MEKAYDIIRAFQDEGDIDDVTMLIALCDFIDGHELILELKEAFEVFKKDE